MHQNCTTTSINTGQRRAEDLSHQYWCYESSAVETEPDIKSPARDTWVSSVIKSDRELTRAQVDEIRKGIFETYVAETKKEAAEQAKHVAAANAMRAEQKHYNRKRSWYRWW